MLLVSLEGTISHVNFSFFFEIYRVRANFQRKPSYTCMYPNEPNMVNISIEQLHVLEEFVSQVTAQRFLVN